MSEEIKKIIGANYVPLTIDDIKTDFIRSENVKQFVIDIPLMNPRTPQYQRFWSIQYKRCIEGVWGKMFGGYRYMSGPLYFYINFGVILITNDQKETYPTKPMCRDLEWERSFDSLIVRGFSGFEFDDEYSCHQSLITDEVNEHPSIYRKDGSKKKYLDPTVYLSMIRKEKLGRCLFSNPPCNMLEFGSRGGGKEVYMTTPILTDKGWVQMKDISMDSKLYARDGNLYNVTGIYPQGVKDGYQLTLQDGRTVKCGLNHLWLVRRASGVMSVIETKEMFENGISYDSPKGNIYKYQIPNCEPIQFDEKELPIDPYLLGCMLGDGTMTTLTPKIASSDPEIINEFKRVLGPDYEFKHDISTTNNHTIVYKGKKQKLNSAGLMNHYNPFKEAIFNLGVNKPCKEKFIPEIYKTSSVHQRLELVKGLMDTDGCATKSGACEFTNTNMTLVQDLADILRSLGIRCQISQDNRAGQTHEIKGHKCERKIYYRLFINTSTPIFKLERKLTNQLKKKKTNSENFVSIVKIEKLDEAVEQQCISVDSPDNTYIINDFVVTHNTYWVSIAEIEYRLTFDDSKRYDSKFINQMINCSIALGAEDSGKSSTLTEMVKFSMECKNNPSYRDWFGIWGTPGNPEYTPCPFYRVFSGSMGANNKKNRFIYEYQVIENGQTTYKGSKTNLIHVNYSSQKGGGAQAASGERCVFSVVEECGLSPNLVEILEANKSIISRDGIAFGVQWNMGTSGNIQYVQASKKVYYNPKDYNMRVKFIPFHVTMTQHKDKDGNTDYEKCLKDINRIRKKAFESTDPKVLLIEKMNRPVKDEEMWLNEKMDIFPTAELLSCEKKLMFNNRYKFIGTPYKLEFDTTKFNGIGLELDKDTPPYFEYPLIKDKQDNPEGPIIIYELPDESKPIPPDMYFYGHDPYVDEDVDKKGLSFGSTYVCKNPKYITKEKPNFVVACYNSKEPAGLDAYYLKQHKLLQLFGMCPRSLWFEKNRGDICRGYYIRKIKAEVLCLTPQYAMGNSAKEKIVTSFGYNVGNLISKKNLTSLIIEFLLSANPITGYKYIEEIPDIFLVRQMLAYTYDGNFDAVDGFRGCILGISETEIRTESSTNSNEEIFFNFLRKDKKKAYVESSVDRRLKNLNIFGKK